jgi:hypothetical protein
MKKPLFHLALVLVSLAVIVALLIAGPERGYRLTVLNVGAAPVSGGTVVVGRHRTAQTWVIPRLSPGGALVFEGTVRGDCTCQISVARESGVPSRNTMSLLAVGGVFDDTVLVADSSLSLRNSRAVGRAR